MDGKSIRNLFVTAVATLAPGAGASGCSFHVGVGPTDSGSGGSSTSGSGESKSGGKSALGISKDLEKVIKEVCNEPQDAIDVAIASMKGRDEFGPSADVVTAYTVCAPVVQTGQNAMMTFVTELKSGHTVEEDSRYQQYQKEEAGAYGLDRSYSVTFYEAAPGIVVFTDTGADSEAAMNSFYKELGYKVIHKFPPHIN